MTQHKARRTNQIAFLPLPWAQEVPGSNPGAPTKNISRVFFYLLKARSEEHTSELQSQSNLVCRLLLEKKKRTQESRVGRRRLHAHSRVLHALGQRRLSRSRRR